MQQEQLKVSWGEVSNVPKATGNNANTPSLWLILHRWHTSDGHLRNSSGEWAEECKREEMKGQSDATVDN